MRHVRGGRTASFEASLARIATGNGINAFVH
jgi:hypothetical protein